MEYIESQGEGTSEDETERQKGIVEEEIKKATDKIEKLGEEKEKELMTV